MKYMFKSKKYLRDRERLRELDKWELTSAYIALDGLNWPKITLGPAPKRWNKAPKHNYNRIKDAVFPSRNTIAFHIKSEIAALIGEKEIEEFRKVTGRLGINL